MIHVEKLFENRYVVPVAIFIAAISVRLLYISLSAADIEQGDDPWYYLQIADNLLNGNGFLELNLIAYRPPAYPFFMAAVLGLSHHSIEIVRVVQTILAGFMCVGIFAVGSVLVHRGVGLLAALFCAFYPQLIHYAVQLYSEQLFLFLVIIALWSFLLSEQKQSLWLKALSGVLFGLSALTREIGLFAMGGVLIWLILDNRSLVAGLRKWWLVALCAFLAILPWSIRNYQAFDKFVPITTNGGINFYIGNNPEATGGFSWTIPPGAVWNKPSEKGIFETQANSLGYKLGLKFIKDNPGTSLSLVFKRAYRLLRPCYQTIDFSESKVETLTKLVWVFMYVVVFVFSLIVAPFRLRRWRKGESLFLIIIIVMIVPFLTAYGSTRYAVSLIPFMALAAAVPAWEILNKHFVLPQLVRETGVGPSG